MAFIKAEALCANEILHLTLTSHEGKKTALYRGHFLLQANLLTRTGEIFETVDSVCATLIFE